MSDTYEVGLREGWEQAVFGMYDILRRYAEHDFPDDDAREMEALRRAGQVLAETYDGCDWWTRKFENGACTWEWDR